MGYQWIFSLSWNKLTNSWPLFLPPHYYFLWIPHSCSFRMDFPDFCSLISWHLRRSLDFPDSIQWAICFLWFLSKHHFSLPELVRVCRCTCLSILWCYNAKYHILLCVCSGVSYNCDCWKSFSVHEVHHDSLPEVHFRITFHLFLRYKACWS